MGFGKCDGRRARSFAVIAVVAALTVLVGGCSKVIGIGQKAGTVFKTTGQGVNKLPDGSIRVPYTDDVVTAVEFDVLAAGVASNADDLATRHVGDLVIDEARRVVKAACQIKDSVEVLNSGSLEQMAANALKNFGGNATLRFRVVDLAQEVAKDQDASDKAVKLAVASICETA